MEYDIVINTYGDKIYYKKGTFLLHREDCPAIEYSDVTKRWYINGKQHRTNGPAVECADGETLWWINGIRLSLEKEIILNKWWNNKNGI